MISNIAIKSLIQQQQKVLSETDSDVLIPELIVNHNANLQ